MYVVGTPIGNLSDMSSRSVEVLRGVDVCFAEDTRRTRKLLRHLDIDVRLRSLHAHNEEWKSEEILEILSAGSPVALVSDAGTPTVSDPGARAVAAAREAGHLVLPVPGPSAVVAALSVSGFPADRFYFAGFAPRKGRKRSEWIKELRDFRGTVVAFEAPTRLARLLVDLEKAGLGMCGAVVCRELTKMYEETAAGTIGELAENFGTDGYEVIGEITLVVGPERPEAVPPDPQELRGVARVWMIAGHTRREVAERLRQQYGLSRNEAYRVSLASATSEGGDVDVPMGTGDLDAPSETGPETDESAERG